MPKLISPVTSVSLKVILCHLILAEVSVVLLEKIFDTFKRGGIGLTYIDLVLPRIFIR